MIKYNSSNWWLRPTFRSKLKLWFYFPVICRLQFSFDPDVLWRVCQWQGIHFSAPAAEGVGAPATHLLVRSPHIWATSSKASNPHPPFSISALPPLLHSLYASSSPISENTLLAFSSFSNICSLYIYTGGSLWADSLHLFANMRKPPSDCLR